MCAVYYYAKSKFVWISAKFIRFHVRCSYLKFINILKLKSVPLMIPEFSENYFLLVNYSTMRIDFILVHYHLSLELCLSNRSKVFEKKFYWLWNEKQWKRKGNWMIWAVFLNHSASRILNFYEKHPQLKLTKIQPPTINCGFPKRFFWLFMLRLDSTVHLSNGWIL